MTDDIDRCNNAGKLTAQRFLRFRAGRTTLQTAYDTAAWAAETCHQSWDGLLDLQAPSSAERPVREAFDRALESCRLATSAKKESLEKLGSLLDGDDKPSALHDFGEDADYDQTQNLQCMADLGSAQALTVDAQPRTTR